MVVGVGAGLIGGTDGSSGLYPNSDNSRVYDRVAVRAAHPPLAPQEQVDAVAASWFTAHVALPGRVEVVARTSAASRMERTAAVVLPVPAYGNQYVGAAQAVNCAGEWVCFRQGYRDFGGNPAWEEHFITDVILGCENKTYGWVWHPEASSYITVAQFHPDSWARASAATGLDDPYNLYHVSATVAYWSSHIEHPGGSGGWAECWWRGIVP